MIRVQRVVSRSLAGRIRSAFSRQAVLAGPDLLADLIDCAQVGVIHQLHEVPVPQLLIGGLARAARVNGGRRRAARRQDLQRDGEEGLGKSVFHCVTLIHASISSQGASEQQASFCVNYAVIQTNL